MVSAVAPRDFPADNRPEIALVGRSNVGKSSLLNALVRRSVARTSASPGKTRQVNVYRITPGGGSPFYLMDLPGYGHAGGGVKAQQEFAALTTLYFGTRTASGRITPEVVSDGGWAGNRVKTDVVSPLRGIVLTVDSRHPGLASDVEAYRWLHTLGVPLLLAATKVDKLTQSEKAKLRQACLRAFGAEPLPISAISGAGLDELWGRLQEVTAAG